MDRTAKAFCVPVNEIRDGKYDLSVTRYKQRNHVEVKFDPPNLILDRMRELETAIERDLQ